MRTASRSGSVVTVMDSAVQRLVGFRGERLEAGWGFGEDGAGASVDVYVCSGP
jgi:hypothetical protein